MNIRWKRPVVLLSLFAALPAYAAHPGHDHYGEDAADWDSESQQSADVDVNVGSVDVIARPDAEIIIDGKKMGRTPLALRLPPGEHSLKLKPAKGKSHTLDFVVTKGKTHRLCWDFAAQSSCSVVAAKPKPVEAASSETTPTE